LLVGLAILTKVTALIGFFWLILLALALVGFRAWRLYLPPLVIAGVTLGACCAVMGVALLTGISPSTGGGFLAQEDTSLWQMTWTNLGKAVQWTVDYNALPFVLLAIAAMISVIRRGTWVARALLLSFLVTLLWHAVLLRTAFPRYLLFGFLPLTILM